MDTDLLRYFLAVAKHSTVAHAADEVHLTQPALSKNIQRLERELGVTLFDRLSTGMRLTDSGHALKAHAQSVLFELTLLHKHMRDVRAGQAGHVTVGCGRGGVLEALVAEATARLSHQAPNITVKAVSGLLDDLLPALRAGEVDMVIGSGLEGQLPSNVQVVELFRDEITIVARKGHPLRRRKRLALADLLDQTWALPAATHTFSTTLSACFGVAGLALPAPSVVGSSINYIARVVARTDHLTFMPVSLVSGVRQGAIAALKVEGSVGSRSVRLLRRANSAASAAVDAMQAQICELAAGNHRKLAATANGLPS